MSCSLPFSQCPAQCPARSQYLPPLAGTPAVTQAKETHPTPGHTTEIRELTCCPWGGWWPGAAMLFMSEAWQGRPPPREAPGRWGEIEHGVGGPGRRRGAGRGCICIRTRLKGEMSKGSSCPMGGLGFVFSKFSLISPNT